MKWWTSPIIAGLVVSMFAVPGAASDGTGIVADDEKKTEVEKKPEVVKKTGPEVFVAQGCNECHTVKSAAIKLAPDGEKESDLSKAGAKHDKKWLAKFILKKVEKDGELHKKKFRGSKTELRTIATWLAKLK